MSNDNLIVLPRSIVDEKVYKHPHALCVFLHILLNASCFDTVTLKRGQAQWQSLCKIADEMKLFTIQSSGIIASAIDLLVLCEKIVYERTREGFVFTVVDFDRYTTIPSE